MTRKIIWSKEMTQLEFNNNIRTNCIGEMPDGGIYYYDFIEERNDLVAGITCNAGLIEHCCIPYDDDFSLDENLNNLIDKLTEMI